MVTIKVTILLDKSLWIALFERTDKEGYASVKHIFGQEPSNPEVHQFIIDHYSDLKFGTLKEFDLQIKRVNPKRLQREIRREMEKLKQTAAPSTHAQDYMREELESNKKEKKSKKSAEKKSRQENQFNLKQEKKKKKHKGH